MNEATPLHTGFVYDTDIGENDEFEPKDKEVVAEEPEHESNINIKFAAAPALAGLLILSSMIFD